ncbi:MAG: gamma-glutamyl-phosphate reductase, partial [Haemophilus parainfluenzae]|nr:gamma-glutamyl-phosphate reductase [Haemophilus parainfluenzae]
MLEQMGKQAKDAAFILAQLNTTEKNHALSIIAEQLEQQADRI